jgi:hypothetical protein
MSLGFVIAGMALGLVSAVMALIQGAGFGMAFLAYAGFGSLGMVLAIAVALLAQRVKPRADLPATAS